jgi:hypothetical protein
MTHKADSANVRDGIEAESGEGTAKALANAADESDVQMHLIQQGVDQFGNKRVRVWTGYEAGEDSEFTIPSKPVPQPLHDLITSWGYEIGSHHDHTADNEQHVYLKD